MKKEFSNFHSENNFYSLKEKVEIENTKINTLTNQLFLLEQAFYKATCNCPQELPLFMYTELNQNLERANQLKSEVQSEEQNIEILEELYRDSKDVPQEELRWEEELQLTKRRIHSLNDSTIQLCYDLENVIHNSSSETSILGGLKTAEKVNVRIYFDVGRGFNETDARTVRWLSPARPVIVPIPSNVRSIRVDPGDDPCFLQRLNYSSECKLSCLNNGISPSKSSYLFLQDDPGLIFSVEEPESFSLFTVSFSYYPLGYSSEPFLLWRIAASIINKIEPFVNRICSWFRKRQQKAGKGQVWK